MSLRTILLVILGIGIGALLGEILAASGLRSAVGRPAKSVDAPTSTLLDKQPNPVAVGAGPPQTTLEATRRALAAAVELLPPCDDPAEIRVIDEFGQGVAGIRFEGSRRPTPAPPQYPPKKPVVARPQPQTDFAKLIREEARSSWDFAGETDHEGVLVVPLPSGWRFSPRPQKSRGWILESPTIDVEAGKRRTIAARQGAIIEIELRHADGSEVDHAKIHLSQDRHRSPMGRDWSPESPFLTVEPGACFISASRSEHRHNPENTNSQKWWRNHSAWQSPQPGEFRELVLGENPPISLELNSLYWIEAIASPEVDSIPFDRELLLAPRFPGSPPGDPRTIEYARRKNWKSARDHYWTRVEPGEYWVIARIVREVESSRWAWTAVSVTDSNVTVEYRAPVMETNRWLELVVRDHHGEVVPHVRPTLRALWDPASDTSGHLRILGKEVRIARNHSRDGRIFLRPDPKSWERLFEGRDPDPTLLRLDVRTSRGMPARLEFPLKLGGRHEIRLPPPAQVELEFTGTVLERRSENESQGSVQVESFDLHPPETQSRPIKDQQASFEEVRPGRARVRVLLPREDQKSDVYEQEFEFHPGLNRVRMELP